MTLVDPAGNPVSTLKKTSVHLVVMHNPGGGKPAQKIVVLGAEVDGTLEQARQVLKGAVTQTLNILVNCGAVSVPIKLKETEA